MMFTIGCDPEVFFTKGSKLISSIDRIGGSKEAPIEFYPGFGILEDNVAAEFNVPPAKSFSDFNSNIDIALMYLHKVAENNGLSLSNAASGCFDMDQLDHPMAFVFGCEPDFNAWSGKKNPKPLSNDPTLRSCGGHVHIGFPYTTKEDQRNIIKAADLFLGVPSINMDKDTKRRELYGKAGAFRYKEYGAEYRTLSNFWIWKEETRAWVYNQVEKALKFIDTNGTKGLDADQAAIQACINDADRGAYNYLVAKYKEVQCLS